MAGDIHYVVLTFLDRKTLRARSLVVHGARLAANYVRGTPHFRGADHKMVIDGTRLEVRQPLARELDRAGDDTDLR